MQIHLCSGSLEGNVCALAKAVTSLIFVDACRVVEISMVLHGLGLDLGACISEESVALVMVLHVFAEMCDIFEANCGLTVGTTKFDIFTDFGL